MNKQIKKSLIAISILSMMGIANAQNNNGVSISAPEKVSEGNSFEKEMTPLLREISKKRSQLELRRLDRELSKIDEEELKAQIDMENLTKESTPVQTPPAGLPGMGPMGANVQTVTPPKAPVEEKEESAIQVLMIYGFDDNLSAKIAAGTQGGYVVKKGDVMPDGRVVTKITPNYIEVKKGKLSKGVARIFVSSGEVAKEEKEAKKNKNGGDSTGGVIQGGIPLVQDPNSRTGLGIALPDPATTDPKSYEAAVNFQQKMMSFIPPKE